MERQNKTLYLLSSDGAKEQISLKASLRSELIKTMIEINPDSNEIPLDIKSDILKKIKEYLEHYENEEPLEIERPLPSTNFQECVSEWDYNFMDLDLDMIFNLMLDSNKMEIKSLLELSSAKIASIIKKKSTEEIQKTFNITNDFTPEEEQQILEENRWCMEDL